MTLPSTLQVLEDYTFFNCKELRRVIFRKDSGLEKIGAYCFNRSGLEKFVAPPKLRVIYGGAFAGCDDLKRVVLNEGLWALKGNSIVGVFTSSCIEAVRLPSTLTEMGMRTFFQCYRLQRIYLKSGCKADLSKLAIHSSVKIIWV